MLNSAITYCIRNPFISIMSFIIIIIASVIAIFTTPIDALPDLSENQVVVVTRWPGQTPKNIEDQVTYPLTIWMQWLAWVKDVRAMSQLGISMVTVIFEDGTDEYFARDRVNERLSLVSSELPSWVQPVLWPDATGLWQIYSYTLESDTHTLTELRTIQDFYVKFWLQSVSWIAEVASIWGFKKNYQIVVDPLKLSQYKIPLKSISNIVAATSNNVSGRVLDIWGSEIAIEWVGFIEDKKELEDIILKKLWANHIKLWDVADVKIGAEFRRGILADDREEKVWGIVVMRYGQNPLEVIKWIQAKITVLEKWLPEWVKIVSFYDRTELIKNAVSTLTGILLSEIGITIIILLLFLWNFWASLVTAISLIIGLLITFLCMKLFTIPSNIMSLGWIAIAIGTMVDAAIVVTENAYNRLLKAQEKKNASDQQEKSKGYPQGVSLQNSAVGIPLVGIQKNAPLLTISERTQIIIDSTKEVAWPLLFAIAIIILSFVPIFALEWQEGKLFAPLAFTNMFAMLWALLASLFIAPVLCVFLMGWKLKKDSQIPLVFMLQKLYKPVLLIALRFRKIALFISLIWLVIWWFLFTKIWSEFMPPLDEWSIMYMPMTVPDVSDRRARDLLIESNRIISGFPEVENVIWKAWRALTATDPAPLAMLETIINLKPKSEWRAWMTKEKLINEMNQKIQIQNLWNGFTQPIIGRIDMLSTGIRAQVWIKIFGEDPMELEKYAIEVEDLMWNVPGGFGVTAIRTTGLQYLNIDIDEEKLFTYWATKSDVLDVISIWVWWKNIASTILGREQYKIELRLKNNYRDSIDDIKNLEVTSSHWTVTLAQIANISLIDGPATINSENGVVRSAVQMNVQWIDLVTFVENGKKYLDENLVLPEWYFVEWTGQYENQLRAKSTLQVVVPAVIAIILIILFLAYKDLWLVSIVALSIPFSLIGWVIALFISGFNFSVAVWVGFISLFWNAVETWVVMILYLENSFREKFWMPLMWEVNPPHNPLPGKEVREDNNSDVDITKESIHESVVDWAMIRLRPVLMTAFTSVIWLFPMIWSTWVGAELQKPLAIVVVGWLITSIILTLIILPILFSYLRERKIKN